MILDPEIEELLEKRMNCGEELNSYDVLVTRWWDEHGVDISDISWDNGCMLVTEPSTYKRLTRERIVETLERRAEENGRNQNNSN